MNSLLNLPLYWLHCLHTRAVTVLVTSPSCPLCDSQCPSFHMHLATPFTLTALVLLAVVMRHGFQHSIPCIGTKCVQHIAVRCANHPA